MNRFTFRVSINWKKNPLCSQTSYYTVTCSKECSSTLTLITCTHVFRKSWKLYSPNEYKSLAILKYPCNKTTCWRYWSNNIPIPQLLAAFYLRAVILYLQVLSKEIYDLPTVAIKNKHHPLPAMSCFIFKFKPHSKTSLNIN